MEEYVLDMLRDQLNRRQPIDNVSRNLLRLLTATCGYKEVRLLAVQRLEMWLQNPKVRCAGERVPEGVSLGVLGGCACMLSGLSGFPAVDQASAGPVDVCVHELQLTRVRRHGCHLSPDQDPPQAQGAPQPLYALHQVCGQPGHQVVRQAGGQPGQLGHQVVRQAGGTQWQPGLSPSPACLFVSRELLNAHKDNLGTTIKFVIFNELSNARNPNNMQILYTVLQHSSELAPKVGYLVRDRPLGFRLGEAWGLSLTGRNSGSGQEDPLTSGF